MWLLGFLSAASGILIGGTIAWIFKGFQQKVHIIYGLCADIIFGLIIFEILPESIELGGVFYTLFGFILGMVLFKVLHIGLYDHRNIESYSPAKIYIRTSILLMLSFSIHNIPIGIALAVSQKAELSKELLQALLFHSIPEGIILFTPLILAGINVLRGLFITMIVSIPIPLGVLIGNYLGFNQLVIAILISVTLGIIFMVTVSEILYPAIIKSSIFKVFLCTLIGTSWIAIYLEIL